MCSELFIMVLHVRIMWLASTKLELKLSSPQPYKRYHEAYLIQYKAFKDDEHAKTKSENSVVLVKSKRFIKHLFFLHIIGGYWGVGQPIEPLAQIHVNGLFLHLVFNVSTPVLCTIR